MKWYLALGLAAAGTYAVRIASVHTFGSHAPSPRAARSLQLVALSVLAAVAVASVPVAEGRSMPSIATVSALVAAAVAARRSRYVAIVVVVALAVHQVVGVATS